MQDLAEHFVAFILQTNACCVTDEHGVLMKQNVVDVAVITET